MKKWHILLLIFISACNPKVVSYVNQKAKFKDFETYRIVSAKADSKNVTPDNTLIFDLIKDNIHNQMKIRSYQPSNISPDLTLRYEVTSSTRVETNTNQMGPYSYPQISTRTFYESVLLIELFDSNQKLVWQGSYDLKQMRKEKKTTIAIEKAIGYIFTSYPYRALSSKMDESLTTFEIKKEQKELMTDYGFMVI